MSYTIISCDDREGTITYEVDYGTGVLREQLRVSEYGTVDEILARIEERGKQITEEVSARAKYTPVIPEKIKAMIYKLPAGEVEDSAGQKT